MNLIENPWIPAKNRSGDTQLIAPWEIVNEDYIGIDSERPDFKGGYLLFLIGLLQTLNFIEDEDEQFELIKSPLSIENLKEMLAPITPFFNLDGEGPRFMQDLTLEKVGYTDIAALAINYPGENTVKQNKDFFVKRDEIKNMCPEAAAIALFTLQAMAPSGGSGHRTGLRGGGPLTSILSFIKNPFSDSNSLQKNIEASLWQQVMINLMDQTRFEKLQGDHSLEDPKYKFPWLDETWTSEPTSKHLETQPWDCHPIQHYWGMPRRIRLDFENTISGICDLFGTEHNNLISGYYQTNYGVNYAGTWRHPLTPYRHEKGKALPFLVPKGGIGFRHWPGININPNDDKSPIEKALILNRSGFLFEDLPSVTMIYVFGYDMDNMKARNWYETSTPLIMLDKPAEESFSHEIQVLIDAATQVKKYLLHALKEAWFNPNKKVNESFQFVEKAFWKESELSFNQMSEELLRIIKVDDPLDGLSIFQIRQRWYQVIKDISSNLFEQWAMKAEEESKDPGKLYLALKSFRKNIHGKQLREKILELSKFKKGE